MVTTEQIKSAIAGSEVSLHLEGVDLVLLRRDVYEYGKHRYDDSEWTDDELRTLASRTFEDADTAGPIP